MSSAIKEVPVHLPKSFDRPDEPWHHYLTIDVIWYVLGYTLFHPFVSWILVLCLRAQYTRYEAPEMRIALAWALLMTTIGIFGLINDKIAFGSPREVDLSEEVIVITGGVEGLGGLLAETYGMRNANIAVLDTKKVDEDEAEEKGVVYYQCDVSNAKQVEAAAAKIVEDLGAPTILINNAGLVHTTSILDSTAEDVEQTFRVNTLAHFNTLRTFLPHMLKEGRGTIITVSSVLGHLGAANLSAYTASKAALLALHHSLRAELAQNPDAKEIKTILVTLGQMSTKMFAGVKTPSNFLAPVVTPAEVGKDIIRLIERGESGEVALPLYSRYIQILGVLPIGVQLLVRKLSGIDGAIGKAGLAKRDGSEKK
ncbi:short chain dehydrogenase/reductase [Cucurbitaria berberidis CBS 394.84]|uniref:Short-chain dehydrogenase/reductase 3 n=1 Tax=Cucurbitaria berberidis CBS 394.84 TaxID=1168544 RepID=A0A9P4GHS2_9PLEO|nr:short chain dehydrogenase/reductase [Cucurbitaria berberidis CBS 394.84]KAF1845380.1 short chain dehydrogenase/reductase [Cucurbitaria berberidis CBS 394.84]